MNTRLISAAVISSLAGFGTASGQQVLATDSALSGARIEIEGVETQPLDAANLIDGDFTSVCRIDNASEVSFIFHLDCPWKVSGWNVVAGSDLSLATGKVALSAYDAGQTKWRSLGRAANFNPSFPHTGIVGKATSAGGEYPAYTTYKIEITGITGALELSEIQLLGISEGEQPLSTDENGYFSTPSNARTPETLNDRNLKTAVDFLGVRTTNGLDNAWIQYTFGEPTAIGAYSVTANAVAQEAMRPGSWELLASDNGEDWVTLDVHCNADNFGIDTYMSTRSLTDQNGGIDFAAVSNQLFDLIDSDFLYKYGNGKYLIHSWHPDQSKIDRGYNYWWMAHAIDAYIDAYIRTGKQKFQTTANSIKVGMYTAYDAGRQDLWNSYYDDMEWMNLACIRAYENFGRGTAVWLTEAKQLFDWIWEGWNYDNGSEGGIRWNSGSGTGKNSCSNAPAMIGAAKLYQITGEEQYLEKAVMIFDWMLTHSRFDDGFIKDAPGNNDRGWTFTYNQGTWIGGLLELYRITQEQKYYDIAVDLLDKCLFNRWYSPEGILREAGWADGGMFKGILIRYITNWVLSGYLDSERQYRYAQYLIENARSFYNCALQLPNLKVMPDWKHRADRVGNGENGRPDGYYCSSNLLSGIFLLESADMLRRAGLTDENYNVINPAVGKPYRHYRIKFTDTHGSDNLRVAGFALYEQASHSGVETVVAEAQTAPVVKVADGRIKVSGTDNALIEVYSTDGILRHSATGTAVETTLPAGIYLVRVTTVAGTTVTKLAL